MDPRGLKASLMTWSLDWRSPREHPWSTNSTRRVVGRLVVQISHGGWHLQSMKPKVLSKELSIYDYPCIYLSIYLSNYLSIYIYIYISISINMYIYIYKYIYIYIYNYIYMCVWFPKVFSQGFLPHLFVPNARIWSHCPPPWPWSPWSSVDTWAMPCLAFLEAGWWIVHISYIMCIIYINTDVCVWIDIHVLYIYIYRQTYR